MKSDEMKLDDRANNKILYWKKCGTNKEHMIKNIIPSTLHDTYKPWIKNTITELALHMGLNQANARIHPNGDDFVNVIK